MNGLVTSDVQSFRQGPHLVRELEERLGLLSELEFQAFGSRNRWFSMVFRWISVHFGPFWAGRGQRRGHKVAQAALGGLYGARGAVERGGAGDQVPR